MTRATHPKLEQWWEWVVSPTDPSSPLSNHLRGCEECSALVETLRDLGSARRTPQFLMPPQKVLQRGMGVERRMAPPVPGAAVPATQLPADVRGGPVGDPTQPRTLSGTLGDLRISVAVSPRIAEQAWQIRGVVIGTVDPATIRVLLVHDDHVLAETTLSKDGTFAISEPAPPKWSLEIRRGDEAWILHGPTE